MRIGVDAWNLADDRRGMGRYVRRILSDWMDDADLDVTLIVRRRQHIDTIRREYRFPIETGVQQRFDVVWYPWNALRFDALGATVAMLFHDAFAFTFPHRDWIARLREQKPIRRAMLLANARASVSRWSAHELSRIFGVDSESFSIIPPVPDPHWRPIGSPVRPPYILVVAAPDERKNIPTLLRAFARAFPDQSCELVIAGKLSGADRWALERCALRSSHVTPTDEQLRALYSGALAVAVPSSAEGYGLTAVEAMACGAPVLASNAAALPEACAGAAILLPPFDTDAWALALERIANDSALRATMREQSLSRVARIDRSEPARLTRAFLQQSLEGAR
jgi:glycosyltransferase involved in cell wall biosynthesis